MMVSFVRSGLVLVFTLLIGLTVHAGDVLGVPDDASKVCPIKVGESIPDITLKNVDGKNVVLSDLVAKGPTLLVFYRGGWCPYCNVHLGELKTIEKDLQDLGYQIVGVSPDKPGLLKQGIQENKLTYQLLSDSSAEAAKAFGLAFRVDDETDKMLKSYNIDLAKSSGQDHRILPVPAAVLIDTEGKVDFVFFSPDYKIRVNKHVILAAAKSNTVKAK